MWTVSELFFFSHSASTSPIHHIKSGLCCIQIDLWFASKLYIHKYSPTHTQIYCFPLYLPLFPPLFCTLCLLLSFWFFLTLTNCIVTFRFFSSNQAIGDGFAFVAVFKLYETGVIRYALSINLFEYQPHTDINANK